jgi:predicted dehydrogenase
MLALSGRLSADVQKARELVASGAIGKLYGVEMHFLADQTRLARKDYAERVGWTLEKARAGGGHLVWLGIHYLDQMMFITDSSVSQVSGFTTKVGDYGKRHDVEDSTVAAVRFDNGTLGTVTSGYYCDQGYNSHIKVWGSKGWLRLEKDSPGADEAFPLTWYSHDAGDPDDPDKTIPEVQSFGVDLDDPLAGGYTPWVVACVDACLGVAPPPISNADGLRAVEIRPRDFGTQKLLLGPATMRYVD